MTWSRVDRKGSERQAGSFTLVVTCLGDPRWSLSSSPPTAETPDSRLQRGSTRLPTTPTRPSSLASTNQQPREADRERPRQTDSFHSTLSTRRLAPLDDSSRSSSRCVQRAPFISTAPRPSLRGARGKNLLLLPPRGGVSPGALSAQNQAPPLHQL